MKVSGRVQRLGYRRYILDLAQERRLAGQVGNNRDGGVTLFVQGEEERVQDFLKQARRPPPPIEVAGFDVKHGRVRSRLRPFTIKFGSVAEELQEGFGAMHSEFHDYRNEFRDYREEFRDYRKEFRDYRGEFNDFAARTDSNFKSLETRYGEISEKLTQILTALETESVATRNELKRAVDNLARLIDQFISRGTASP